MTPPKLVAFDLDGTLTRGPTCLEAVADRLGFAAELARWDRTRWDLTRGDADVIAARTFWPLVADCQPDVLTDILAAIPLAPGAVEAVGFLRRAAIPTVIVTLTFAPLARWFAQTLGIDHVIGTEPRPDGSFRHVLPSTKPLLLQSHAATIGIELRDVAAIGDSPGDIAMLRAVGTPVYVGSHLSPAERPGLSYLPGAALDAVVASFR
jgi:phosphoserine phosphatase